MNGRQTVRLIVWGSLLMSLVGCVSLVKSPKESTTTFLLTTPHGEATEPRDPLPLVLYVPRATAPAYLDSTKILFSRSDDTVNSYQYAQWAEPPPARITALLVEALEDHNLFRAVTRHTSGTSPDLALNLELLDFRHDARTTPGDVVMRLKGEIVDLRGGRVIETRTFQQRAPIAAFDAATVTRALSSITAEILTAISTWLSELATKPVPRAVVVER